ncbi:hypothetical protein H8F21_14700 [Pseudomonas sp. P66]|uniref:MarR family transcriptional regulator n=1 Tax=Pseudomonas arcuscaelestis TaxID=2710591 RepID=A0ABS2BZA9_9PSED|nr:hypothetical protein [Pseudomonas arcuscaelestis]MBM5458815.1 hypothetical protein [Pseudomonas arcuscaelestis]
MSDLQTELKDYVEATLGAKAQLKPVALKVPFHIQDAYRPIELGLQLGPAGLTMLLLLSTGDKYPGIVSLNKHIAQVRKATDAVIVYVCKSLSAHERRSLITHHINFVQPGYQMFVPEIAIELREKVRRRRLDDEVSALLPAAQAMLLSCLYNGWTSDTVFQAKAIMGGLQYSRVTLSKVVDQLLALKLLQPAKSQKSINFYAFGAPAAGAFRTVSPYMRSPVRRKVAIDSIPILGDGVFLAGETALAKYTMLAEPDQPIYGMTKKRFDELVELGAFKVTESVDHIQAWVEIWSYCTLKEHANIADEASLLLGFEGHPDDRIQIALDQLKGQVEWLSTTD